MSQKESLKAPISQPLIFLDEVLPSMAETVLYRRGARGQEYLLVSGFSTEVSAIELTGSSIRKLSSACSTSDIARFELLVKLPCIVPYIHTMTYIPEIDRTFLGLENGNVLAYKDLLLRNCVSCFEGHLGRVVAV